MQSICLQAMPSFAVEFPLGLSKFTHRFSNRAEINEFLGNAGYKYAVSFEFENDKYKMKLRHSEYDKNIAKGDQFLSFGERNAFSLVLFMYETLSKNVDLIVLDDPISSFDRNKKFAIIDMLFMKKRSFKNKTVLMLTHDFEPIIDMMHNLYKKFMNSISASFLVDNKGQLHEIAITKDDIKLSTEVCLENIENINEQIIKLIHLRRYYEIISDKGIEYELLSNLFHKRDIPIKIVNGIEIKLAEDEISTASRNIRNYVADFEYQDNLKYVKDDKMLISSYNAAVSNY